MDENFSILVDEAGPLSLNRTLSLDTVRTFAAVCETRNFKRAAAKVNRSPSAVSLQIVKLEDLLGCVLLHRNARNVALTEQGEQLLAFARRLLELNDEVMAHFHGSSLSGKLRLAAQHDLGVSVIPGILRRFSKTHPGIRVDVRLDSSVVIQRLFASGQANIALIICDLQPTIPATRIFSEDLCWLARRGGRAAYQKPLPLAVAEIGCSWREAALRALGTAEIDYRIAYSSDTSMGQLAAVRADLAVAALPRTLIDADIIPVSNDIPLPPLEQVHMYLAQDGSEAAEAFAAEFSGLEGFSSLRGGDYPDR